MIAMALTDAQQAQHDNTEWAVYQRLKAEDEAIAEIWHPQLKLVSDYRKARSCYVKLHLYRTDNCNVELLQVDRDLGSIEVARSEGR
jgi:hypothetical protein